jgi:geranylgeranyl diphosphate synthase type I
MQIDDVMTVISRVDRALADFLAGSAAGLEAAGPELVPVTAAARDFVLSGGKRMRPVFAYWGWRCVHHEGAAGEDALVRAAAGLELLHAAALVHDDLIDDSDTRRGQPAAHARFATVHRDARWSSAPLPFGRAAAILLGDLLLSWSWSMVSAAARELAQGAGAMVAFDAMCTEMMAGQYLDVLEQARGGYSVETALRVARFKSSKYTVERPLHLGAAAGGGSTELMASLSAFGVPLGEAFQLRDDVLGVFGDPARTGKPAGDDLREGKRTVLVALAHDQADAPGRAALEAGLGDGDIDADGISRLRDIIVGTGALDEVERMIAERTQSALVALDEAVIRPDAKAALSVLAGAATERSS